MLIPMFYPIEKKVIMAQEEERQLALQALAIMTPHLNEKLRVSLQADIDAGEPYEALIPLVGEAPKYGVSLPEELVRATMDIAEQDDKDDLGGVYAY
ncbi:hypothetical protein [Bifidobacterium minimum]|nr:hypothetical protein [Bifidobacterium minimum]